MDSTVYGEADLMKTDFLSYVKMKIWNKSQCYNYVGVYISLKMSELKFVWKYSGLNLWPPGHAQFRKIEETK